MISEKSHDFICFVIFCMIDKEDDALDVVSFCICYEVAEMLSELYVSATLKRIPYDAFARPKKCNKTIHSLRVAKCCYVTRLPFSSPAALGFWKKLCPLLVLEAKEDLFFKSAGATRLYLRISARLR